MWLGGYLHNLYVYACMWLSACACVHFSLCSSKSSDFFFSFLFFFQLCHYRISTTKTEKLIHQSHEHHIWVMYRRLGSLLLEALDILWSVSRAHKFSRDSCSYSATSPASVQCYHQDRKRWEHMEVLFWGCRSPLILQTKTKWKQSCPVLWHQMKWDEAHCLPLSVSAPGWDTFSPGQS